MMVFQLIVYSEYEVFAFRLTNHEKGLHIVNHFTPPIDQ